MVTDLLPKNLARLVAVAAMAMPGLAQIPGTTPSASKSAAAVVDPLGRETPRGTLMGFMRSAQKGRLDIASQYLQLSQAERLRKGEVLASELLAILDHGFPGTFDDVSSRADGSLEDGIPTDRERAGVIDLPERGYDLLLTRIDDGKGGKIWVVSAETVSEIPEMHAQVGVPKLEKVLPAFLVNTRMLGAPLWQLIAPVLAMFVVPAFLYLFWIAAANLWSYSVRRKPLMPWWKVSVGPVFVLASLGFISFTSRQLGIPLLHRFYYNRVFGVIAWLTVGWLAWKIVERFLSLGQRQAVMRFGTSVNSAFFLGRRVIKALMFVIFLLLVLQFLGLNITTALAGLGIGGLAVALAAQKTLENFISGVTLITDQVISVGDSCKIGDRQGTVEDISLRSTRLRTLEGSQLSIPNGLLAGMTIESFTNRPNILFKTNIGLRYETTAEQMDKVLAGVRSLLSNHPKIDPGFRVRLSAFGASSFDIDLYSQVTTSDFNEFTEIREKLMFKIIEIVQTAGASFAFPSQTLYMTRDK